MQAAEAVAAGARTRSFRGSTGPRSPPRRSRSSACGASTAPRSRSCCRSPAGRCCCSTAGANVEVRPEQLVQFAYMGACFMEAVYGLERPRVGLLSVGEEPGKGTPDVPRRTSGSPRRADFAGNVEGFDLPARRVDVIVTDGFTGNVALKVLEGRRRPSPARSATRSARARSRPSAGS